MIQAIFNDIQIDYFHNSAVDRQASYPEHLKEVFDLDASKQAIEEIRQWPNYTPLLNFVALAQELGLGGIYYKDERDRFGLGSLKSLGGAYEVLCLLQREVSSHVGSRVTFASIRDGSYAEVVKNTTVVTATDGNHGRSVAWGAHIFGCKCVIYIHAEVSAGRKAAMEEFGARVVRIDGNYDDSVTQAAEAAAANGWFIVSDISYYEGYTDLPRHVMAGYTVMADEIMAQLPKDLKLTHTFIQGGVGGLAGAMCGYMWQILGSARPRFAVVEPNRADCLFQTARHGKPTAVNISEETIMAGLSCGKVSYLAWKILSLGVGITLGHESYLRMPAGDFQKLMRMIQPAEIIDSTPLIRRLRNIKSQQETEKIRYICDLTAAAFEDLPNLLKAGDTERQNCKRFRIDLLKRGADNSPYLISGSGPGGYDSISNSRSIIK